MVVTEADPVSIHAVNVVYRQLKPFLKSRPLGLVNRTFPEESSYFEAIIDTTGHIGFLGQLPADSEVRRLFFRRKAPIDLENPSAFTLALSDALGGLDARIADRMEQKADWRISHERTQSQERLQSLTEERDDARQELVALQSHGRTTGVLAATALGASLLAAIVLYAFVAVEDRAFETAASMALAVLLTTAAAALTFYRRRSSQAGELQGRVEQQDLVVRRLNEKIAEYTVLTAGETKRPVTKAPLESNWPRLLPWVIPLALVLLFITGYPLLTHSQAVDQLRSLGARVVEIDGGYQVGLTEASTFQLSMDVGLLEAILNLQSLDLRGTAVTNLAPLQGLTSLQSLDIRGTAVEDLAPLQGLTSLQSLDLWGTAVRDLAPLQGLTSLQSLDLMQTKVTDLTPLQPLTSLQSLDLRRTAVTNLAPLQGLTSLESLNLMQTNVTDLTPLQGLTSLESLNLMQTNVTDLTPLQGLTSLESLNLMQTKVTDLTPLQDLTSLQSLDLSFTLVTDLTTLQGLTSLQSLDLRRTAVTNLTPLQDLTSLQSLDIRGTAVEDLAPLQGLTSLQSLDLSSTNVRGEQVKALIVRLPNLTIDGGL